MSATGPAVATCCPDVPANCAALPLQVTPVAVAGCPPAAGRAPRYRRTGSAGTTPPGRPRPGSVTDCDSMFPAGS